MYIQFKDGFVEADRWDGNRAMPADHLAAISRAVANDGRVIVVRSRERATIKRVIERTHGPCRWIEIFNTPEWDYEFRCYLGAGEWCAALLSIAMDIDYRNFKAWSAKNSTPARSDLASEIWHAAQVTRPRS